MPALAMAQAAWSWVLKMLQLLQVTSAPSSASVSIKHRGLDRHVQAAGDAGALERLGAAVLFAQGHQAGHFVLGELDFLAAPFGEAVELGGRTIDDLVRQLLRGHLRHGNLLIFESNRTKLAL